MIETSFDLYLLDYGCLWQVLEQCLFDKISQTQVLDYSLSTSMDNYIRIHKQRDTLVCSSCHTSHSTTSCSTCQWQNISLEMMSCR